MLLPPPRSPLFPYTTLFRSPEASIPPVGARVMDLQHPTNKMSKSADSPQGTIRLLDDPKSIDRKSTRLNSSHVEISYAVFCLKKKNNRSGREDTGGREAAQQ